MGNSGDGEGMGEGRDKVKITEAERDILFNSFVCQLCGKNKTKSGAYPEVCLSCERGMNSQKQVIIGEVKREENGFEHGLGPQDYFIPVRQKGEGK